MKTRRLLLAAVMAFATGPASAFDRVLPTPRIKDNGDVRLSDDLKIGRYQGGKFTSTPDAIVSGGPASVGLNLYPLVAAPIVTTGTITAGAKTLTLASGASVANGDTVYDPSTGETIGTIASGAGSNTFTLLGPARISYTNAPMRVGLSRWDANSYALANTIGAQNVHVGLAAKGRSTWLPLVGAAGYDYPEVSRLTVLGNSVGATFGVRSSDLNSGLGAIHAAAFFTLIDTPKNIVDGRPNSSTTRYLQAGNLPSSIGGDTMIGEESSMLNFWPAAAEDPFTVNPYNGVRNQRYDCGWGYQSASGFIGGYDKLGIPPGTTAHDCSAAIDIVYNDGKYGTGITFGFEALNTDNGRLAPALALPPQTGVTWFSAAGVRSWDLVSTATGGYGKLDLQNNVARLSADFSLEAPAGGSRSLVLRRNGASNISLGQTGDASGDLAIATFNDAGSFIEIPFRLRRGDGKLLLKNVNLSGLPASATGLVSGDLWRDTNNFLKVVP